MSRPDQLALVLVVFAVGVGAGTTRSGQLPGGLAFAAAALGLVAASVHLVNEYADAETDAITNRTRFSGGSGALAELNLPRSTALVAALLFAVAGAVVSVVAAFAGHLSRTALLLLVVGLVGGWLYSVGPLPLSRHGWGEVANAALGGLVLPAYGVAAVTGGLKTSDVVVFVPFALLVFVNLLETQWPDRDADRSVGKHTLTSRLSPPQVRGLATASVALAYGLLLAMTPTPMPSAVAAASFLALPLSAWGLVRLTRNSEPLPGVLAMVTLAVAQAVAWAA